MTTTTPNTIAIESFITFCDDMMIAEESFSSIKSKIVTLFSKLVLWIESKVKKMKDSKVKSTLMKLLSRAKRGLAKSKSLNEHNPDMVRELQEEASEIKEEVQEVVKEEDTKEKEDSGSDNESSNIEVKGDKTIIYEKDGKTLSKVKYEDGHWENYTNGKLRSITYVKCPSEKKIETIWFEDDGKTYEKVVYKDGHYVSYENGRPHHINYAHCKTEKKIEVKYFADDGQTIKNIDFKDGRCETYTNSGKLTMISYKNCPSEKKILTKFFDDDGKTLVLVRYKDGKWVRFKDGKPESSGYGNPLF